MSSCLFCGEDGCKVCPKLGLTVDEFRMWLKKVYLKNYTGVTPGQLIDLLFTTDYKCWWAQEKIGDETLSDEERLKAAIQAQEYNAKRTRLIRTIDHLLGFSEDTNTDKTYG